MSRIFSFPPLIDERAKVLIAGTAPSVKSLEHGQFYGHPQNYFWRVVYGLFQVRESTEDEYPAPDPIYENRITFLQSHRLSLWDVIASCEREGSLDVNIKGELLNDIPNLLIQYPDIRCIAFNGSKAYDTFQKNFREHPVLKEVTLLKLPSTSPIPTKYMRSLEDRINAWRIIVPFTNDELSFE
ncbi:DNA-deoxyinosine glycosylase [Paenibacillus sp. GSMTC-2017]|uniref:DNA-deoxyinosine glycosylase n=1 Tax=Paenibacillus sp. GSMTC-2017 TaxID=2794350 RepID=UPI0018D8E576|nr:DNA-deoxyinosine glycosylase [Paenibacillus sp. GSMTC-2017]MBH5319847.1 DNA-deoxyinosine glycosylase [Paenibacillus sp. GSMTC-2017]